MVAWDSSALRFRLLIANVFAGNELATAVAGEISAAAPDLVFLQEATPAFSSSGRRP